MSDLPVIQPSQALSADPRQRLAQFLSERALRLLSASVALLPGQVAIYAIPRPERVVLVFNLDAIKGMEVPQAYLKKLVKIMNGRRVVVDWETGMFVQIGYEPEAPVGKLEARPLDLKEQPSPLHVPVGMTAKGPTWLSLLEMDSILIGGARRMGKTRLLHAWIQALVQGGQAMLVLWDGKNGAEFERYAGHPHGIVAEDLPAALANVQQEITRREVLFKRSRVTSLPDFNRLRRIAPLPPIVLLLDELADLPHEAEGALIQLVRRAGAYGVHPIVGIQRPDAEVMKGQLRANLTTRFALPVASHEDSRIILGRTGAEKLPKVKGRLLYLWNARLVEAQAFLVNLGPERQPWAESIEPGDEQDPFEMPRPEESVDPLADTRPVRTVRRTSLIPERERRLVAAALQAEGWFRVREVAERAGQSHRWVNEVAQRWETVGYLTPVQRNPLGHTLGRRVTPLLLAASGLGGSVDPVDPVEAGAAAVRRVDSGAGPADPWVQR